jgi:hypothetical protein
MKIQDQNYAAPSPKKGIARKEILVKRENPGKNVVA